MEIEFKDAELANLYEGNKVKNKLFKSNPQLKNQYVKTVNILASVSRVEELNTFGGLNYKKLTNHPLGLSAVRINQKYRLLFKEVENEEDPPEVVLFEIEEISNHYGD
jgi:proteic killer suppression protein